MAKKECKGVSSESPDDEKLCDARVALDLSNRIALKLSEAAVAIGVSERHLKSHLDEVPHVRLGKRLLFPVDALREWLASRARQHADGSDAIADAALRTMGRRGR